MGSADRQILEDKEILRSAIKERKVTKTALAGRMGMLPNALTQNITRDRMGLDNFKKILNALGYDVVVVDRISGEQKWVVDPNK